MKKNGQYVGVDQKYVPDDEKYVDNNLNSEIKNDMHNIYKDAKEYVSDKDNQEKMKNVGRKGLKIAKGIGIGYIVFFGFAIVMIIVTFILVFSEFFKMNKQGDDIRDNIIDQATNNFDDIYNKINVNDYNFDIETYSGTQYGSTVSSLLDNVITKIKKNTDHTINVVYGSITTSKADEITALKKQFDRSKQYEVSIDYDSDGYINKVTITDY